MRCQGRESLLKSRFYELPITFFETIIASIIMHEDEREKALRFYSLTCNLLVGTSLCLLRVAFAGQHASATPKQRKSQLVMRHVYIYQVARSRPCGGA